MDTYSTLKLLDEELSQAGLERSLYICGGAALILLQITTRATMDVDVLRPKVDPSLAQIAKNVATKLGLSDQWLNNGPEDLLKYFDKHWEKNCVLVYDGISLQVFTLGRLDLIKSKLWASCDRMDDIPDLVALKPSLEELKLAHRWVLQVDASEIWSQIVESCLTELKKHLTHG